MEALRSASNQVGQDSKGDGSSNIEQLPPEAAPFACVESPRAGSYGLGLGRKPSMQQLDIRLEIAATFFDALEPLLHMRKDEPGDIRPTQEKLRGIVEEGLLRLSAFDPGLAEEVRKIEQQCTDFVGWRSEEAMAWRLSRYSEECNRPAIKAPDRRWPERPEIDLDGLDFCGPNVSFLATLGTIVNHLGFQNQQARFFAGNRCLIAWELLVKCQRDVDFSTVFTDFSVSAVVDSNDLEDISDGCSGLHVQFSELNILPSGFGTDAYFHENIHVLEEGLPKTDFLDWGLCEIDSAVRNYVRLLSWDSDQDSHMEQVAANRQRILAWNPTEADALLDKLHSEVVAAVCRSPEKQTQFTKSAPSGADQLLAALYSTSIKMGNAIQGFKLSAQRVHNHTYSHFDTCGHELEGIVGRLRDATEELVIKSDEPLVEALTQAANTIEERYTKFTNNADISFRIAKRLGPEVERKFIAAMVLLPPSRFHFVDKWLDSMYGVELIRDWREIVRILKNRVGLCSSADHMESAIRLLPSLGEHERDQLKGILHAERDDFVYGTMVKYCQETPRSQFAERWLTALRALHQKLDSECEL